MLGAVLFCVLLADVMYITVDGLIGNEQGFFGVVELGSCFGCVVSNFLCFENSGSIKTFAMNTSPACPAHLTNTLKLFVLCSLHKQQ
jgi:hypothetical protein